MFIIIQIPSHYVDKINVVHAELSYKNGLITKKKVGSALFNKDGCLIELCFSYPAEFLNDSNNQLVQPLELSNGRLLQIWNYVDAEGTDNGRKFIKAAYEIINPKLIILKKELEKIK